MNEELRSYERRLPHWRLKGSVYFVTWRLAEQESQLSEEERGLIQQAVRHFDQERYLLYAYVVMDDHVHVVFKPLGEYSVSELLHSWKSYTSQVILKGRGANGQLWLHESWDRIVRSEDDLIEKCQYVLNNPFKRWPELQEYPWVGVG